MSRTNRGKIIASTLLLVAVLLSSCNQAYSTAPAVTNTPLPENLFATTIPDQPDSMSDVENFTTQTALAAEQAGLPTATPDILAGIASATPTPVIELHPTATATQAVSASVPTATTGSSSSSSGPKPGTYVLKSGEFPYCIARRFNVDPEQLLSLSGLSSTYANSLSAGTVLTIPQSGSFPGDRALAIHPTNYTVTAGDETVYGVACRFGDVDPAAIAQANGISVDASLTVGQTLSIP